ncbi:MAG: hypothetical protein ACI841_004079 [Planctomycetota bacterium]|jgi:hypothetical protein
MSRPVLLLGPQRVEPTLRAAVDRLGVEGPIATVTAGWEEREGEDEELAQHLGGRTRNLGLFPRAESVFEQDSELFAALSARYDRQSELRELYRSRLAHVLGSARELFERKGDPEMLAPHRAHAVEAVRALDCFHLQQRDAIQAEFDERWHIHDRESVAQQRLELRDILNDCGALCIAGGHVGILLSRLRIFGVLDLFPADRPIIAWSAGSMVLSERVVLFHDSPPQGAGDAEVWSTGLGIARGVVPLPHAGHRLRLDDRARVALFSRRFAPSTSVALLPKCGIETITDETQTAGAASWRSLDPATKQLTASGELVPIGAEREGATC